MIWLRGRVGHDVYKTGLSTQAGLKCKSKIQWHPQCESANPNLH
ncbi:hypothetical protein RMSM_05496 [Rhodopirellula maiorica SM1]|uniref:Uncharacterized protein n=1 Tax=Rhodopirellula maiorica SM1 TaxID=1265738 RepID=M5RDM7_9BACT|nr:hypothetical protein RMSM_05496 [Rhodopirellula maiorica SM1]